MTTEVTNRVVAVGDGFEVEYAGKFIRMWHSPCLNHDLLPNDDEATVETWKATHRCGDRIAPWDRGDVGGRV